MRWSETTPCPLPGFTRIFPFLVEGGVLPIAFLPFRILSRGRGNQPKSLLRVGPGQAGWKMPGSLTDRGRGQGCGIAHPPIRLGPGGGRWTPGGESSELSVAVGRPISHRSSLGAFPLSRVVTCGEGK